MIDVLPATVLYLTRGSLTVLTRNPSYHLWDILLILVDSTRTSDDMEFDQQLLQVLDAPSSIAQGDMQTLAQRESLQHNSTTLESRYAWKIECLSVLRP